MTNVLELRGITKRFPGVLANDKIDITLREGKILALLGENGAGKSTLMNILYGLYKPDEGQIFVRGQEVDIHGPNDAIARGIGMVHQHFMLVPVMTVTENVMLGVEPVKNGILLDQKKVADRIREISDQYGLEVDPEAYIKDLPVGIQQRVEIIKVLYRSADILILDEPTAGLDPIGAAAFDDLIRQLSDDLGLTVFMVTHDLDSLWRVADRVAVLGLGPLGLLLAQILRAAGCRVAGFDLRNDRLQLAAQLGISFTANAQPPELPGQLRAWQMPEGFDAAKVIDRAFRRYNLSLGAGLSKVAGKVFRIGHLGDCNDLTLVATLAILLFGGYRLGQAAHLFSNRYELIAFVPNANGLRQGGTVTVAGHDIVRGYRAARSARGVHQWI